MDRLATQLHAVHGPQWTAMCIGMLVNDTPELLVHVYAATRDWGLVVETGTMSADGTGELVKLPTERMLVPRAAGDLDGDGNDEVLFSDRAGYLVQHLVDGVWVPLSGPAIAGDCPQDVDIQGDTLLVDALGGPGCLSEGHHAFKLVGRELVEKH